MKSATPAQLDGSLSLAELIDRHALDDFETGDLLEVECEPGWHARFTAGALRELITRLQHANNYWLAGKWLSLPLAELLRPMARQDEALPARPSRRRPLPDSADALMRALDTEPEAFDMHPQMSKPPDDLAEAMPAEEAKAVDPLDQPSGGGAGSATDATDAETAAEAVPPQPPSLQREEIRLDVVTPETAVVDEPFDMAVAIRQPASPALSIEDLPKLTSTAGEVYRAVGQDLIKYRVEVAVDECEVKPARYDFRLAKGRDSIVQYFQLTPKRAGNLSIIVNAYQADSAVLAATTRVRLKAGVAVARGATTPAPADTIKLYEALTSLFQLDDVQDIAFRLNIKWDELAGDTLSARCRSLLTYCNDRSMTDTLRQTIKTLRPEATL
jgi:hypothetical protein